MRHARTGRHIPLVLFAAMIVASFWGVCDEKPGGGSGEDQIKQARKAAAHRQRRIIFDNDGDDVVYECKEATAESLLSARTSALVGTQVDSIFYCTWSSGLGMFTHNTKIGEVFTCTAEEPGKGPGSGFSRNQTKAFIDQGTDPLRIMTDFCRKHGIEIFWSMRINDCHDAWGAWYSPYMFPALKKAHPDWLIGSEKNKPKNGTWTALDFAQPEVRDLVFRFFEEVCRNYDVDGVQLDFFRHPSFFRKPAMGEPASQENLDMMTDLLRRIRTMADAVGAKRGRPILISVRVPDSVEFSKMIGLDIVRWMAEDLTDLLVLSCYFRLNPWEDSVAFGHKYGVPVYPCLSESRLADGEARKVRGTIEHYRARAMNVWDSGADGVYMFNFFNPASPMWRELGARETLAPLDKMYTTSTRGFGELEYWYKGGKKFMNLQFITPDNPRTLAPGRAETVPLDVGESVSHDVGNIVLLRLRVKDLAKAEDLGVKVNGVPLAAGAKSEMYVDYPVKSALIKRDVNEIEMSLKPDCPANAVVTDVLLRVRHGAPGA